MSIVLKTFEYRGSTVEVLLELKNERFKIYCYYEGGGLVNGYSYYLDNIGGVTPKVVKDCVPIQALADVAKSDVLEGRWQEWEKALVELGALHVFDSTPRSSPSVST